MKISESYARKQKWMFFPEHSVYVYLLLFPRYNDLMVDNLRFRRFTNAGLV